MLDVVGWREDTEAVRVCTLRRPLAALGALASPVLSPVGVRDITLHNVL